MGSAIVAAATGLAFLLVAGAARAETLATPLPDGQVLLEVSAHGSARSPADSVTLTLQVMSGAATATKARAANQVKLATLAKSLEPLGISNKDIDVTAAAGMSMDDDEGVQFRVPVQFASATVQVTLADPSKLAAVREVLNRQEVTQAGVVATAKDSASTRRAAIADAVAKAKADAAAYADALGLRISRVVRVSNVAAPNLGQSYGNYIVGLIGARASASPTQVDTPADVTIEFLAAPR